LLLVPIVASAQDAALPPLDQLLAPVALYPDPLISLILPASTLPDQVSAAASFLQGGGDPSQGAALGWDASIQGLAHYPSVLEWMSENSAWTEQLGGAFASQPGDVMDAVQDLRRRAQAAGTLMSNEQQQVVVYENSIEILPQQSSVIYVPEYDPAVVYVEQPAGFYGGPLFAWSQPYPAGAWLSFDFDWRSHAVWQGDWYDYRMNHGGWGRPVDFAQVHASIRNSSNWRPPHNAPPAPPQLTHGGSGSWWSGGGQPKFAQPRTMTGTPPPRAGSQRANLPIAPSGERPAPAREQAPAQDSNRREQAPVQTQQPEQTQAEGNGRRAPESPAASQGRSEAEPAAKKNPGDAKPAKKAAPKREEKKPEEKTEEKQ
jgi:hypothetical protein